MPEEAGQPERRYFRVVFTYNGDRHTAHRIFKHRVKAEHYAAWLNTPLVKKVSVKEIPLPQLPRRVHKKRQART